MWKILGVCLAVLLLDGCAVGVKHDYSQSGLDLPLSSYTVSVGTLDHRTYIENGRKQPDFVGLSRGGFGNPFDVTTKSGKPLASDISGSIVTSLKSKGVNAQAVDLSPGLSPNAAEDILHTTGAQRSLLITLKEWKGDAMMNVGLAYDFNVRVLDKDGKLLTSKDQKGNDNLGGADPFKPGGASQIPPRFRQLMEALFKDPDVAKAFRP